MPAQIVGMIGVAPPAGSSVHVIAGEISRDYLCKFSKAHEDAGYDMALVGYYGSSAEGLNVAMYAAQHTEQLKFLIAHRPGLVAPTLAARKFATFDQLTGGRLCIHIIAGVSDAEQQSEGDFLPKDERYRRAEEYIGVMRRVWTETKPFDHEGQHYRLRGAFSDVRPFQQPSPPVYFGGSSAGALSMGARQCDVFAMFAEPLKDTAERMKQYGAMVASAGRSTGYNMSVRPIIAETEGAAWDKAHRLLRDIEVQNGQNKSAVDESGARMVALGERGQVHDERLWMGIASAMGGLGNTTCLVGTPKQVGDAILAYYRVGVESFLIRGFDPLNDTTEFGRELIPYIKAGALRIDQASQPAAALA